MQTELNRRKAAKEFAEQWKGIGKEKSDTQTYWNDLLRNVFGIDNPASVIKYERPVRTFKQDKGSDSIDAYISTTKVLIEQKSLGIDLSAKLEQSDGAMLTAY